LDPNVPYAWQEKNTTIEIPSNKSKTISVLGFLGNKSQFHGYTVDGSVNSEVAINCFNDYSQIITKDTVVIIDNSPVHTSKAFKAEIKNWNKKKLFIRYLPTYSPELNEIEILWRFIKYEWMPFEAYQSEEKLSTNVDNILSKIGTEYKINFTH
jgi:transposase